MAEKLFSSVKKGVLSFRDMPCRMELCLCMLIIYFLQFNNGTPVPGFDIDGQLHKSPDRQLHHPKQSEIK